ncbi:hypothetical protein ABZS95_26680 [Streptomyces sp. NPDC005479]|uniref:hypothetical protein n=1 Tax=Streptomyces sp. NPDC005479 TaxID=3154879 RepID=UPI0033AD2A35
MTHELTVVQVGVPAASRLILQPARQHPAEPDVRLGRKARVDGHFTSEDLTPDGNGGVTGLASRGRWNPSAAGVVDAWSASSARTVRTSPIF